ncbi:MAG: hypothetical protein HZA92_19630 [Verrucomicrobia bacterium]|nr:hypothetical protein [Verrucomicrobiota bacterium]
MKPAPKNPDEFEPVKKLLALKRREEPPPGYFDRLPGEVRARIVRAEANPEPWWRGWLESWDLSPTLATGYVAAALALLLGGVWFVKQPASEGSPQVVTTPVQPVDPNLTNTIIASNAAPPGLFNPPSLPVQPAEFKKQQPK